MVNTLNETKKTFNVSMSRKHLVIKKQCQKVTESLIL